MTNLVTSNRNGRDADGNKGLLSWVLLACAAFAAAAWACGGDSDRQDPSETITGMIVEVEAGSLIDLDSLTVRDAAGTTWRFVSRNFRGFTPSHLNEHRVQGQSVTVAFHRENGDLIIDAITD